MMSDQSLALEELAEAVLDGAFALDEQGAVPPASTLSPSLLEQFRHLARIAAAFRSHEDGAPAEDRTHRATPRVWNGFELLDRVGAGTFGEVYRALDPTLDRIIALKLHHTVPAASETGVATTALRAPVETLAEARILARVTHLNVVTIHGAAFADGRVGLWMEFVDGHTLYQRISGIGPLRAEELQAVVRTLSEALAAVHASGLIHGDISAKNVMVSASGRVVLMDFGASREQWRGPSQTATIGTPMYMAPELFEGHAPSVGSDLFSLGALAYFAAVGAFPYSESDVRERAVNYRSLSLRAARPDLPVKFCDVIDRLVARDRERRYETAADVVAALDGIDLTTARKRPTRRTPLVLAAAALVTLSTYAVRLIPGNSSLGEAAPVTRPTMVAVLPIRGADLDPSLALLSTLPDQIVREFRHGPVRAIIASAGQFTPDGRLRPDVAKALELDVAVWGTVSASHGQWGLALEGRDAATGRHLWRRNALVRAGDFRALETKAVGGIAEALGAASRRGAPVNGPALPQAEQEVMKGVFQLKRRKSGSLEQARRHFMRALELDPTLVDAHAQLASTYALLGQFRVLPRGDANRRARATANVALALDQTSAEAYAALGYVAADEGNLPEAEEHFKRAMALDPFNANAPHWYALTLAHSGRATEAVSIIERARELDPLSPSIASDVGVVYLASGNRDGALAEFDRAIALDPSSAEPHLRVAEVFELDGQYSRALERYEQALRLSPLDYTARGSIALMNARLGLVEEARRERAALEQLASKGFVSADIIAQLAVALGDVDGALYWVAKRFEEGSNPQHVWGSDRLAALRTNPRFKALVAAAAAKGTQAPWSERPRAQNDARASRNP